MRRRLTIVLALISCAATTPAPSPQAALVAALASPDRPAEDTARDANRKPGDVMAFAGIGPGETVADIMPGGGYFTRLFSKDVGPGGKVYALVPSELLAAMGSKAVDPVKAIAASPAFSNVSVIVAPTAQTAAPGPVDVAWTAQNYHDLYGFFGADQAAKFDAAVYRMLRPGGVFIVIDHVAAPGSGSGSTTTLHRIDPAIVKAQVTAAGFVFEGESDVLRNPDDKHDLKVFDPAIRGKTDQFVFKFRKPAS